MLKNIEGSSTELIALKSLIPPAVADNTKVELPKDPNVPVIQEK